AGGGGPKWRPVVILWDVASGRAVREFESGSDPVEALAFSGDGLKLAAGGGRKGASGWGGGWGKETRAVLGTLDHPGLVKSLAFNPNGARLAVADFGEARVHLWDVAVGTRITIPGPRAVSCVRFNPDGTRLAALGYDGNVHLADARTGEV